ncbi:hypothetical protein [Actinoplanes rectilineatus]|uniref:hypothetical protein n=1 Tax=Actinoplanes rectilineatus TaxID=113571 RepID=UPI000698F4F8|nr:hypothetical protein [Actinoplanes rectilineatus]
MWSVPVAALLVVVLMPVNDAFYEFWINYDPQGDGQQWEWGFATDLMRGTSGVLCGHFVAFAAGLAAARRHRHRVALGLSVLLGTVMALVAGLVLWLRGERVGEVAEQVWRSAGVAGDGPPVGTLLLALAVAFPLYAAAGAGLGAAFGRRVSRHTVVTAGVLTGIGWTVVTLAGLLQNDDRGFPAVLLWLIPPLAAATAVGLGCLSLDAWSVPPVVTGDWGDQAITALLVGLTVFALILNVLAVRAPAGERPVPTDAG